MSELDKDKIRQLIEIARDNTGEALNMHVLEFGPRESMAGKHLSLALQYEDELRFLSELEQTLENDE